MKILDKRDVPGVSFEETMPGVVYRDSQGYLVMSVVAPDGRKAMIHLAGPYKGQSLVLLPINGHRSGANIGPFVPVDATLVIGEVPA